MRSRIKLRRSDSMPAVPKPNFKRRVPKRINRGKFDKKTRERIIERDNGLCRQCGRPGDSIHHVKFRSQMGEGIYTNGMVVCNDCHIQIHQNREFQEFWQNKFAETYGEDYWHE